jgi:SNF2 family DNA or RNA helicase
LYVQFLYNPQFLDRFKFEIDGRAWDSKNKIWTVPAPQILKLVKLFGGTQNIIADDKVKKIYDEELKRHEDLNILRQSDDSELDDSTLLRSLYGFQRVGVNFVKRAGGRALIADEPGSGKTAQSIAYSYLQGLKTLIICPKSVKIHWTREIEKMTGQKSCIWEAQERIGHIDNQWHISHYEIMDRHKEELQKLKFDCLVVDEATKIKNRKTKMAKAIFGDGRAKKQYPGFKAKHVLFLTGTPILNRPVEAFVLLNYLDKNRFNNLWHFIHKYGGWKGDEPRNLEDLRERTKELIIRRRKKDTDPDLPPKQRNDLYIELTPIDRKEYNILLDNLFRKWNVLGKPTVAEMSKIQEFLSTKKLPRMIEMVDELIDNDRSVLIFSCYLKPLHELHKYYKEKAVMLYGTMTSEERQESIDALRNKTAKIGLFSIRAGGLGIDGLQDSIDTALFMDLDWVPATHEQAEDRIHRKGQKSKVQAFYFICDDTIDQYMRDILSAKQHIIDTVLDDGIVSITKNKSFFKEFVKILRTKQTSKLWETINSNSAID